MIFIYIYIHTYESGIQRPSDPVVQSTHHVGPRLSMKGFLLPQADFHCCTEGKEYSCSANHWVEAKSLAKAFLKA